MGVLVRVNASIVPPVGAMVWGTLIASILYPVVLIIWLIIGRADMLSVSGVPSRPSRRSVACRIGSLRWLVV